MNAAREQACLFHTRYDAFGNIASASGAGALGHYAWTGRELEVETGLQYNRARYYDSTTGRWISQDQLGFDAGDSNLYRYVNNRPTNSTDPSGKFRVETTGFNRDQHNEITKYCVQARDAIKNAMPQLIAYRDGKATNEVKMQVNRWFSGGKDLNDAQIKTVIGVYEKVLNGFDKNITSFVNFPKSDFFGDTQALLNNPDRRRIALGKLYHNAGEKEQFGTIIHEFMHYFARLPGSSNDFKEKYFRPETAFDEKKAVQFWDDDDPKVDRAMTTDDRIKCADAYAGFITAYHWKK